MKSGDGRIAISPTVTRVFDQNAKTLPSRMRIYPQKSVRSTALSCTATSGGATSATGADWNPLRTRTVIIWPDNDDPGKAHAGEVASILLSMGCDVSSIEVDKLELGILKACEKRPIGREAIGAVLDRIEEELRSREADEVPSTEIGAVVGANVAGAF